jgi:hypothetical protein
MILEVRGSIRRIAMKGTIFGLYGAITDFICQGGHRWGGCVARSQLLEHRISDNGGWVYAFEEEDEGQFRYLWGVESPRAN